MNPIKTPSCFSLLSILIAIIIIPSCGLVDSLRIQRAIENESINNADFRRIIPFKEVNGAIIVEAKIDGVKGNYILDSGASTVVDRDLLIDIDPERMGKSKSIDSNGKKVKISNVRTNEIEMDEVVFKGVVAYVLDMEKFSELAGMPIDGIIGANVMKECVWQINYRDKIIVITDDIDELNVSSHASKIDFYYQGKGVPTFDVYLGNQHCGRAIFDTGSNGGINLDYEYLDDHLSFEEKSTMVQGTHSRAITNMKIATVPSFKINGSVEFENTVVSFEEDRPFGIVGNEFLRNYIVTFDWAMQRVYLDKYEDAP